MERKNVITVFSVLTFIAIGGLILYSISNRNITNVLTETIMLIQAIILFVILYIYDVVKQNGK